MVHINFDSKASVYEQNALVQKSASSVLLGLMAIQKDEDVLDLGCGSGRTTREIALLTKGLVVGTDISESMIDEAIRKNEGRPNVRYLVKDAECLGFSDTFDVIYCNSAFQWFSHPKKVLEHCFTALKAGGRMGIQAPATSIYCPNFVTAVEKVRTHSATKKTFGFFKETKSKYKITLYFLITSKAFLQTLFIYKVRSIVCYSFGGSPFVVVSQLFKRV
jgi:ubiquinone/menaquinone biosynthesis C-methylase UbiE